MLDWDFYESEDSLWFLGCIAVFVSLLKSFNGSGYNFLRTSFFFLMKSIIGTSDPCISQVILSFAS